MKLSPAVLARLREIIVSFAGSNGDPHPTRVRMVETNSAAYNALRGIRDNEPSIPVYLVVADGHFVGMKAPPRRPPPRGTMLYMLLDRRGDFGCVGWGLGPFNPDLLKLGTVTEL